MFSWAKSFFQKRKNINNEKSSTKEGNYLLVYTKSERVSLCNPGNDAEHGEVFYHFFENPEHKRYMEFSTTLHGADVLLNEYVQRSTFYNTVCKKWLSGRFVSEIPSYEDAKSEDVIEKLKS